MSPPDLRVKGDGRPAPSFGPPTVECVRVEREAQRRLAGGRMAVPEIRPCADLARADAGDQAGRLAVLREHEAAVRK